jgi:hypothetical protein
LSTYGDGEMSGMDFQVNKEYSMYVPSQSGDEPTKEVTFRFKPNGNKLEVDASTMSVEVLD